ncbi:MAG: glucosaminidase domain-containing protein [Crocinitomicaceae bacterium]|nr:glucosaminidase domain-containing protein [Crocinitomicaceae bacterium]
MKRAFLIAALATSVYGSAAEKKITTSEYVEYWKITAIEQMNDHGIPASITLAQGILESGNGNSRLAKEANNHFGIKCHRGWDGATFIQDDDKKNECFRSYDNASQSYEDHSLFLTGRERYSDLFELKLTDYKGWAKGLKSAGYATNPKYADLLIDLIEKNDLAQYDLMPYLPAQIKESETLMASNGETPVATLDIQKGTSVTDSYEGLQRTDHLVFEHKNDLKYIIVKQGDTFYQIAKEFDMGLWQLYKYNDFGKRDVLKEGEFVYLVPKRNRAKKAYPRIETSKDMTYRDISQNEGIKLKKLLKLNGETNPDKVLPKGTKVILR